MFMHILIMSFNKFNYVHISVFFSDYVCLSMFKILWVSSVQQLGVGTRLFSMFGSCHQPFEDVTK